MKDLTVNDMFAPWERDEQGRYITLHNYGKWYDLYLVTGDQVQKIQEVFPYLMSNLIIFSASFILLLLRIQHIVRNLSGFSESFYSVGIQVISPISPSYPTIESRTFRDRELVDGDFPKGGAVLHHITTRGDSMKFYL